MSRDLNGLHPAFRVQVVSLLEACKAVDIDLLVTCTTRTNQEQAALYSQGRTTPGVIVTWARPGESKHETGEAVDVVPMRNGKCVWSTSGLDLKLWGQVGLIGEKCGMEWAGRWPAKRREFAHFQFKGVLT